MPVRITVPSEDGEPDRWIQVRDTSQRFKAGERRKLYEIHGEAAQSGLAPQLIELSLMRHMACHLVHSWSLAAAPPRAVMANGDITYENINSLDELDVDMENELFFVCAKWVKQISINFSPTTDPNPDTPTGPSAG